MERRRRVLLGGPAGRASGRIFALDGLFETFLEVLEDFGAFPAVIDAELQRYLPFLGTTKVLVAAMRHGIGRRPHMK